MDYKSIVTIHRKGKEIAFLLKEGEYLTLENIIDVEVHSLPEAIEGQQGARNG